MGGFTPCLPYTALKEGGQGRATTQDETTEIQECSTSGIPQAPEAWWRVREEEAPSWKDTALSCTKQCILDHKDQ